MGYQKKESFGSFEDSSEFSYAHMKPFLDAISFGVILVDEHGRVRLVNRKAQEFLGYKDSLGPFQPLGVPFREMILEKLAPRIENPDDLVNWLEMEESVMGFSMDDSVRPSHCDLKGRNGFSHLLIQASPVLREMKEGTSRAQMFVLQDISEKRRKEEILEMVSLAARELNRDLNIREMLSHLSLLVGEKIPADAMAIVSIRDDGRGQVIGAIPDAFLGGAGAHGPLGPVFLESKNQSQVPGEEFYLVDDQEERPEIPQDLFEEGKPGGEDEDLGNHRKTHEYGNEFLCDIVSDIPKALGKSSLEEPPSMLPRSFLKEMNDYGMRSMIGLPLTSFGKIAGIWIIASRKPQGYSLNDLSFLEPLSEHLAVAVHNSQLLLRTKEMYTAAVKALAATVDIRDAYTMHHSEHVAKIAGVIARAMGLPKEEVDIIELAGLVHDIGKVGIPDAVLQKPGPLDPSERVVMTSHSVLGAGILERAGMLKELAPIVLHHHEWHNGSGYPGRLKGESIPLGASILSVADAFDTMISDRVYRQGMSLEEARQELRRCQGGQFNPSVVAALDKAIDKALGEKDPWLLDILDERRERSGEESRDDLPRTLVEQQAEIEKAITSKELGVLFKITQEMRRLLDLKELLNHILQILAQEMGYSDCVIMMPDEMAQNLVISASIGMSEKLLGIKIPKNTGISWWVMEHGVPQNIKDVSMDERYYEGAPGVGSELYIPLDVRGKRLGILLVQKKEVGGFSQNDERLLTAVAGHIASALEVAQLHEEVKKAADTDALTGLYNRRKFLSMLNETGELKDEGMPKRMPSSQLDSSQEASILIVDVDSLKTINDTYGHLAGDRVLKEIARDLKEGFRVCDIVARYGGDEFVVYLPSASFDATEKRIKDIIQSWRRREIQIEDGRRIPMPSASFGVASSPKDGREIRVLLAGADNRLLQAKPIAHATRHYTER